MATSIMSGESTQIQTIGPGIIHRRSRKWVQQKLSYVVGGITFNYPAGLFSGIPTVKLGCELTGLTYATNLIVSPVITANSSTSMTVRVNINSGGTLSEASNDDVLIHMFATY